VSHLDENSEEPSRQVVELDRAERPQRIFNTRGDHGADRDAAGLADALEAERIERRRCLQMQDPDVGNFGGVRHQKIHQAGIGEIAVRLKVEMFVQRAADEEAANWGGFTFTLGLFQNST